MHGDKSESVKEIDQLDEDVGEFGRKIKSKNRRIYRHNEGRLLEVDTMISLCNFASNHPGSVSYESVRNEFLCVSFVTFFLVQIKYITSDCFATFSI